MSTDRPEAVPRNVNDAGRAATAAAPLVLVIDDEPQIRRFLEIGLRAQGYRVECAATAEAGLEAMVVPGADLVVLDLGLPDRDGGEVLKELRRWTEVPIIVLTVRSAESEKVAMLDAGANDYVTKPFGVPELMARIRAVLRSRSHPLPAFHVYDDGRLRVDLGRREVVVGGQRIELSRKEYALLATLVRHPGLVVTQPQLLRELWGPSHQQDTHYLRILLAKLRYKLSDPASAPRYIATETGVGLRFIGEVNRLPRQDITDRGSGLAEETATARNG